MKLKISNNTYFLIRNKSKVIVFLNSFVNYNF